MKILLQQLVSLLDRRSRLQAIGLFVLMTIGGLLELAGVLLLPVVVMFLAAPAHLEQKLAEYHLQEWINLKQGLSSFLVCLAVFFIFKGVFLSLLIYLQARFQIRAEVKLSRRLVESYLFSPYERQFSANSSHRLYIVLNDIPRLFNSILNPFFVLSSECIVFLFISMALFYSHPLSFLSALVLVGGPSSALYFIFRHKTAFLGKKQTVFGQRMSSQVNQSLGGLKEIKVLGREHSFLEKFESDSLNYSNAARSIAANNQYPKYFTEVSAILAIVVIIFIMLKQSGDDRGAVLGNLAFFALASIRLLPSLNRMIASANSMLSARYAMDQICQEFHQSRLTPAPPPPDPNPTNQPFRNIEFRQVSYQYPGAASPSLQNIDMVIPQGVTIAFTGPSGAGKTTCVDILLGLLQPTQGSILVDGIEKKGGIGLQTKIGYIPQTIYLADDTILRNIAFGVPDLLIDENAVREAAATAQLSEFIKDLPEGLNQKIGEQGIRLSGGQRQRIGIARALYHRPEILVMDEATSSLDNETERSITSMFTSLHGKKTIVIIAHRLSTIQHADTIYFFTKGSVAARGTYPELIQNNPAFASLAAAGAFQPQPAAEE